MQYKRDKTWSQWVGKPLTCKPIKLKVNHNLSKGTKSFRSVGSLQSKRIPSFGVIYEVREFSKVFRVV